MATVNLIECDGCKRQEQRDPQTTAIWSRFQVIGLGVNPNPEPPVLDICPGCRVKLENAIAIALGEPAPNDTKEDSLKSVEREHIIRILTQQLWNKAETSRILGVTRATLDRKLTAYGLTRPVVIPRTKPEVIA